MMQRYHLHMYFKLIYIFQEYFYFYFRNLFYPCYIVGANGRAIIFLPRTCQHLIPIFLFHCSIRQERVRRNLHRPFSFFFFFFLSIVRGIQSAESVSNSFQPIKKFVDEKSQLPKKPRYVHFDPLILSLMLSRQEKGNNPFVSPQSQRKLSFNHCCCAINTTLLIWKIILPFVPFYHCTILPFREMARKKRILKGSKIFLQKKKKFVKSRNKQEWIFKSILLRNSSNKKYIYSICTLFTIPLIDTLFVYLLRENFQFRTISITSPTSVTEIHTERYENKISPEIVSLYRDRR